MWTPVTIPAAIGNFLTHFRKEHDLTLDQIARSAREFGASWSASSVRNIENGKAVTSLPNLLALGLALHDLTDIELTLSAMLGGANAIDGPTALGMPVKREWLDEVLAGGKIKIEKVTSLDGGEERMRELVKTLPERARKMMLELPEGGDLDLVEQVKDQQREPTLAEERAAQKLGIGPRSLRVWAWHLWGRDLEDEASRRAAARATQLGKPVTAQAKGSVTRILTKEIAEARAQDAIKQNSSKSGSNVQAP